jgi:hypothetical protein
MSDYQLILIGAVIASAVYCLWFVFFDDED